MKISLSELEFARDAQGNLNPRPEQIDTTDLQASLAEHGQVEPIIVTAEVNGKHIVLSGHRRVTAARALGWSEIEAVESLVPGNLSPTGIRSAMLAAHARADHDPLRVAETIKAMLADGWDKVRVARVMGAAPQKVDILLALALAPASVQNEVRSGRMSLTAYGAIYAQSAEVQKSVVERITDKASDAPARRGPGRPPASVLTVGALKREVKVMAAEQSPRLLDDEAQVSKIIDIVAKLSAVSECYAGGVPADIGWRISRHLALIQQLAADLTAKIGG